MQNRSWRIDNRSIDDIALCKLTSVQFKKKFLACINGDENEFSRFVKPFRNWHLRPAAPVWAKLRTSVFARDDYTCRYCGERGGRLECDHVMPVSRGGSHDLANLVTACFSCNRSKRDKTLDEWTQ